MSAERAAILFCGVAALGVDSAPGVDDNSIAVVDALQHTIERTQVCGPESVLVDLVGTDIDIINVVFV